MSTWGQGMTSEMLAKLQADIKARARLVDRDLKAEPHRVRDALPVARGKRVRKAVAPSEHAEQVAVIQWFDLWGPLHGIDRRLLFAVPNGSHKSFAAAGMFKAEGLRAGCPDLCLALPAPGFHGMFVEMKSVNGRVSPEQSEFHAMLRRRDYNVVTCYGADAAIRALTVYCEAAVAGEPRGRPGERIPPRLG